MDFKDLLEQSWKTFTKFIPPLIINTLVLVVISFFTLGILAPVCMAGYTQSLLLAVREQRKPEVKDLFSHMNLFLPLLAFFIVAGIVISFGFIIMVIPGIIAGIALYFFCLYLLPLMTDKDMGLIEAVKESSNMAMEDPIVDHIAVVAIYIGITAIGGAVPFGAIFTLPFATLFMLYAFEEKCGVEMSQPEKSEEPKAAAAPPPPPPPKPEEPKPTSDSDEPEAASKPEEKE